MLSDPHAVVGCVPGASIVGQDDDGSLDASVVVKFGPTRVTFRVQATLDAGRGGPPGQHHRPGQGHHRRDADAVDGAVRRDARARRRAARASPIDGTVEVSGRLASLIEGGASLVVKRMSGEFAERLAARCSEGAQSR